MIDCNAHFVENEIIESRADIEHYRKEETPKRTMIETELNKL